MKIKCGVNYAQTRSQSSFIQLTPHFTVVDIWKGFGIDLTGIGVLSELEKIKSDGCSRLDF
jgi:hypothetical protein